MIIGPVAGNITIANLMTGTNSRNPLTSAKRTVSVNNVICNWSHMGMEMQSRKGAVTNNSLVGNVLIKGLEYQANAAILIRADSTSLPAGSKVFVADSDTEGATSDPWAIVEPILGSRNMANYKSSAPVAWPAEFTTLPTEDGVALNQVLKYAGARPADRDSADKRIVQQVRDRTGTFINCVAPNGTTRCNKNSGGLAELSGEPACARVADEAQTTTSQSCA